MPQDAFLAAVCFVLWGYCGFIVLLGFAETGTLVLMLASMLWNDLWRFLIIFMILLFQVSAD